VKPASLLGANSAELQVTLKADDEATSGLYSSGTTSGADAEISRFGKNDTTTRVRVDSLKLFEVSSFASQLMAPDELNPSLNPAAFSSLTAHARRVPVQGRPPGHIAFGVAVRSQQAENVGLNFRERHGRPARSVPPVAALDGFPRCARRAPQRERLPSSGSQAVTCSIGHAFRTARKRGGTGGEYPPVLASPGRS